MDRRHARRVCAIIRAAPLRWDIIGLVRSMHMPDGWIGAGFVRNAVWDHLHGRTPSAPAGDVDVVWFDRMRADPRVDRDLEAKLRTAEPSVQWSVKNQARMHTRNNDDP